MIPKKNLRFEHEESERINRAIAAMSKDRGVRWHLQKPSVFACAHPSGGAPPVECLHGYRDITSWPYGATLDNYVGSYKWARCQL